MSKIPKVILLVDTSRESGRKLLRGVAKYCRLHGPWAFHHKPMFYEYQDEYYKSRQWEERTFSRLERWGGDAVIANNINYEGQLERILAMGLPTIIIGGCNPNRQTSAWHRILSDSQAIGKMAAEHLLD